MWIYAGKRLPVWYQLYLPCTNAPYWPLMWVWGWQVTRPEVESHLVSAGTCLAAWVRSRCGPAWKCWAASPTWHVLNVEPQNATAEMGESWLSSSIRPDSSSSSSSSSSSNTLNQHISKIGADNKMMRWHFQTALLHRLNHNNQLFNAHICWMTKSENKTIYCEPFRIFIKDKDGHLCLFYTSIMSVAHFASVDSGADLSTHNLNFFVHDS